jgi:phage recombination protein Bet
VSTELSTRRSSAIHAWDTGFQKLVTSTLLRPEKRPATAAELALFAEVAQRSGLDPFARQIFGVFRYDSRAGGEVMTVQVSIDGLRLIAERSGKYEGQTAPQWCGEDGVWVDVWLKDEPPAAARVGIHKARHREPSWGVATWREFCQTKKDGQPTAMWKRMGPHMLAKCAEALGLRKAFPAETSGLYTPDEPNTDPPVEVRSEAAPVVATPVVDGKSEEVATAAAFALDNGLASSDELMMMFTAHGAGSTDTLETAVASLPAESHAPMLEALYALEPSDAEVVS